MRIGAFAPAGGVSTKTVRFYEQVGLLPAPPRTSSGYRGYPPQAVARLAFVRAAQSAGLSLAEIREVLAVVGGGAARRGQVTVVVDEHLCRVEERIEELTRLRAALRQLAVSGELAALGGSPH
jgi:MerR family copper efflux transcriptional regulator